MTDRKRPATESLQDLDLVKKHHKFLREDSEEEQEERHLTKQEKRGEKMAKKYYDKLYKEYALVDLRRFEKGQIGCRWRTEKQVIDGKGQDKCGELQCKNQSVNVFQMYFGYLQEGVKKNALVKVSVCKDCAFKLNYKKALKKVS